MKLYRVTLRGMTGYYLSGHATYGIAYVVCDDAEGAYEVVKARLDKDGIGFSHERVLDKVELIAEDADYPGCGIRLYVHEEAKL